jgi:hypothetical protein
VAKNFRDKIALSGFTVLGIGVGLLIFTFASAYVFLIEGLQIISTQDLAQAFGEALSPLIATSIRVMYLGVMGWIGSLMTIRGITMITNAPKTEVPTMQKPQVSQQKPQLQQAKNRLEMKPATPASVVIPLQEMEQPQQKPQDSRVPS